MTRMGMPVPPGFTSTTEACRSYLSSGAMPPGLLSEVEEHLREMEMRMDRHLDDANDPLLLSVRSGGKFSMPGMMETILDIGLTDRSLHGLVARSGDERFAWDSYRRLIQMFGRTVAGVPAEDFEAELTAAKAGAGVSSDTTSVPATCSTLWRCTRRSSTPTPAANSRRRRTNNSSWPSSRSSRRGTPNGLCSTVGTRISGRIWAPR
jgi:phosphoenolpyruvate synthase/pyruvate phosphate dikinase